MTNEELKQLSQDVSALFARGKDWKDVHLYHTVFLPAAAIGAATAFFNVGNVPGVCNLDKPSQVSYPTIVTEIGLEIFGTMADYFSVWTACDVLIQKDHRGFAPLPVNVLPSGSGANSVVSGPAAAALIQGVSNGKDGRFYELAMPFALVPDQILAVTLRGPAVAVPPVLVAITGVSIMLKGLVSRSLV
jgi:hypothetical protein